MKRYDLDFTKCRFDVNKKNFSETITKSIPEFKKYNSDIRDNVFRFIVMLFDMHSPLWDIEKEYFQRKMLAADLAAFPKTTFGNFKEEVKEIIQGESDEVNVLTVAYVANLGNVEYQMLINEIVMFHGYTAQVLSGKYDHKSYQTLEALSENIRSRTRKVFGAGDKDEHRRVQIELYEKAERDRQKLNPEAIVKMLDNDGDFPPDWNRYGKDYKVDELKFYRDEHTEG